MMNITNQDQLQKLIFEVLTDVKPFDGNTNWFDSLSKRMASDIIAGSTIILTTRYWLNQATDNEIPYEQCYEVMKKLNARLL
jgi:hypothetical protein